MEATVMKTLLSMLEFPLISTFELAMLTLELEFVKKGTKSEQAMAEPQLPCIFHRQPNLKGNIPTRLGIKHVKGMLLFGPPGTFMARQIGKIGAELEGVVKSATSYALNRVQRLSMDDLTKPVEEENIRIHMEDFLHAIHEVQPAFGASTDDLERCRLNGMVDSGDMHDHIKELCF
ncbi:Uncharacterized protein Rs2_09358 [Raphanus sativus]|nr:Uncharacterized protein Rs2_09358 [Raphanus sativus]